MTTNEHPRESVYGPAHAPRMKWKCRHCVKRNDHALHLPIAEKVVQVCRSCKRASVFDFTFEPAAPPMVLGFDPAHPDEPRDSIHMKSRSQGVSVPGGSR